MIISQGTPTSFDAVKKSKKKKVEEERQSDTAGKLQRLCKIEMEIRRNLETLFEYAGRGFMNSSVLNGGLNYFIFPVN